MKNSHSFSIRADTALKPRGERRANARKQYRKAAYYQAHHNLRAGQYALDLLAFWRKR